MMNDGEREFYIVYRGNQLLISLGLAEKDWTIKLLDELENDNIGKCWEELRLITLSRDHLFNTDERNIEEAILHEVAHALTSGKHNQEWYDKWISLGADGGWYESNGLFTKFYTDEQLLKGVN